MAPAELEAALLGCPAVLDVAVIGVRCDKLGEAPKAFVVKQVGHDTLTPNEVAAFLHNKVAEYKRVAPEHIEFIEAVPKSAAGKILRRELREREAAAAAAA